MSRAEYLSELEKLLSDISADEKQDALGYYYDYLDVDDTEDLEERMKSLGTPEELAAKIKLASSDTNVIDGEFTETGYSDSIDDTRDVPDKYTQITEGDNVVGDNGEPKYTIFGVKITKSVLILLIVLFFLIVPAIFSIFKGIGKGIIKAGKFATGSVMNVTDIFDDIDDAAEDILDKGSDSSDSSSSVTGETVVIGEASTIKDIELDIGAVDLQIKDSTDGKVSVDASENVTVKFDKSGSNKVKIQIESKNKSALTKGKKAILYMPNDSTLDDLDIEAGASAVKCKINITCKDLDIELGAGDIEFNKITADDSEIKIGAGKVSFDKLYSKNANIEVGMGDFCAEGDIENSFDLVCTMGNATLKLDSAESDHNYDFKVGMGNLNVGSTKISGMASEREIDNDASSTYSVEVGMGNVNMDFNK